MNDEDKREQDEPRAVEVEEKKPDTIEQRVQDDDDDQKGAGRSFAKK